MSTTFLRSRRLLPFLAAPTALLSVSSAHLEAAEPEPTSQPAVDFVGVFVEKESAARLRQQFPAKFGNADEPLVVVLRFQPTAEEQEAFAPIFGRAAKLHVKGLAEDDHAQTVLVAVTTETGESLEYDGAAEPAHVTLSTSAGGLSAGYSSVLLERLRASDKLRYLLDDEEGISQWTGELPAFESKHLPLFSPFPAVEAKIVKVDAKQSEQLALQGTVCLSSRFDVSTGECQAPKAECGFCKFMKAGPCGKEFTAWEACLDSCKKSGDDFIEKCGPQTLALRDCVDANPEYYHVLSDDPEEKKDESEAEDNPDSMSSLRTPGTPDRLKAGLSAVPVSASWHKAAVVRRPQLAQLPAGPLSAPKQLQQQQNASPNQQSVQPLRRTPSGVPLNRSTTKRVTKVPTLSFNSKRRGRNAISNQFSVDGARRVNAGVYLLENVKTGHRYFGTTWDLHNAAAQSFHDLQLGVHPHQALSTSFQLYGEAASGIGFRVLEQVSPPSSPRPPAPTDQVRAKRRRVKRLTAGRDADNNKDGFDVRAMERKLATRLRFHQRKVVRRAAYKIVRRFLVLPLLARAWPLWVRVTEGCTLVERTAASVEIQRVARGYLDRVVVDAIRRYRAARILQRFMRRCHFTLSCKRRARSLLESKAAGVLQRSMREFVARRKARRRREGVRRWLAARKLQTHVRRHLAHRLVDCRRLDKRRALAAIRVQRITRGHLARLRVQRLRQRRIDVKAATSIQKMWRGYLTRTKVTLQRSLEGALSTHHRLHHCSLEDLRDEAARTIQQAYSRWKARRLREQNEKATTIRLAYRNYVARKFGWAATTVLLETAMANRIQRLGRRWMFQRRFRRVVTAYRRDKAALCIQCCTRQYQARLKLYKLRKEKKCTQAIRRIQAFWRAYWMLLRLRERVRTRKRERAARQIQATLRAWIARREYLAVRDLARRNRAATQMQCMFRARQARRELMRRQVVRRLGGCENCRSQLATVYHFEAESELCAACSDEFASLGDAVMETIDVNVYHRIVVPLVSAQRAYRAFQTQKRLQFGTCTLCEKHAVRRSCWSCLHGHSFTSHDGKPSVGLMFCRSCDALFHERKQHQRKNIEAAYAEEAAAVTIQKYYRRFAQRHTLADLHRAQQTAAAKRVQGCFRRHRQRRITRAICAAHGRQQVLEASAARTIQRVVRGHLARCERRRLKHERDSATRIQRAFRRHQVRRVYNAAVVIQSHVRGWLARRVACALRQERLEKQRNAAACCIQRHTRGFLARRRVRHLRQQNAAVRLQSVWRGYVARCEFHALQLEKQRQFNDELRTRLRAVAAQIAESERVAATRIQTIVRGRQARIELYRRKRQAARSAREQLRDRAVELEVASATCIQRRVRERITMPASHQRLRAQCCARCFLSRRTVKRMRMEKQSAVRIQRAFRYSRAKRRLARLVDDDTATPAPVWVELFDEASGYVYYYHTETGQSVWERPQEMDTSPENPTSENVGEWVEYWDENVDASYFYNVKTGEATWSTPAGYQSSNQEDTTTSEAWPMDNGGTYYTLPSRSKMESTEAENQQMEAYGDQYAPYGYEYGEDQAYYGNNNNEGAYYYYGDGTEYAYPLEPADNEQYGPVDTEYDINYKIYLTQIQQEQQQEDQQSGNDQQQQDQKRNDTKCV
ncbi:hypothetical protein PC128_g20088 [Phytophthora cactorum]|nr:hypothetical protein PC128_g20088 [Phytophthora cactorum]